MVKSKPSKQSGALGDGLLDALVQASFVTMAVLNKIGAENDLSLTQLRVCGILRDRRPRMAALADYLGLEKSTMTGLINRAEKRGFLARAASPEDGRATEVFLTNEGRRLVARLYLEVKQELAPLMARLDSSEQRHLQELLRRMLDPQA